jgi:hypothetical protein
MPVAPIIGNWYRRSAGGMLEVVAVDLDDGSIEVQHFDGTVEELDLESWNDLALIEATAPEDWTGSVDVVPEDYESERTISASATDPLDYLDRNDNFKVSDWPIPDDGM